VIIKSINRHKLRYRILDISYKGLTELPDLSKYINLQKLDCSRNQLTSLDNLPSTLTGLDCRDNQLISLDN
jgi:Leucine-rich repeat (LRR) protein